MQSLGLFTFTILIVAMIIYFGSIFVFSKGKRKYLGFILPGICTLISLYYYIKPVLIPNPYPTMQESILMTFFGMLSILGFIVYGTINHLSK